mmetsp:Transcript_102763/g.297088  ORF Transcript_102763/g.297088 Transcript_102763/m.297088 type:complete len:283 (-) Transcript_102763:275-1123(-)
MVMAVLIELVPHDGQRALRALQLFPHTVRLLVAELDRRQFPGHIRGMLLVTELQLSRLVWGLLCHQFRLLSLLHLLNQLLVHMRSPCKLVLQILVNRQVSSQLRVLLQQLVVAAEEALGLLVLEVELCDHLLILHDGALRRLVELVFRLGPEHLSHFTHLAMHVLLELINLHGLLAVECANIPGMRLGLLLQLTLQSFQLGLLELLVLLKGMQALVLLLKLVVLRLQANHLVLPHVSLSLQAVFELLLGVLQLLFEALDCLLLLLDSKMVLLDCGLQVSQHL